MAKKIAILGGGPSGLAAAFRLTEEAARGGPEVDITVYQMGWRVGGKGTSGYRRWTPPGGGEPLWNRIEEHGLHILFGFYETFFSVIRKCYEELNRPAGHPLRTFEDAFEPRDFGTTMYRHRSRWKRMHMWFHRNHARPGTDDPIPEDDDVARIGSMLASFVRNVILPFAGPSTGAIAAILKPLFDALGVVVYYLLRVIALPLVAFPALALFLLRLWQKPFRQLLRWPMNLFGATWFLWLGADYFVALAVAAIESGLVKTGDYESLDHLDLRDWLSDHGLAEETSASPLVGLIYHAAFSYAHGEADQPRIAAGSALRLILRAVGQRKGSAYNRMRGGMGEVVFVPLYQALKARGVKFELFHRVDSLQLDATKSRIETIRMTRQAKLAGSEYQPTVQVKGVDVFPSEPLWDQLDKGDTLHDIRFESYYQTSYPTGAPRVLHRGDDFDQVVLATPIATLPYVADELIQDSPAWKEMVTKVKSVQTVSLQVWFDETHLDLGWRQPDPADPHTLLSMYAKPMSTWVPMDQTLPCENWPDGMEPAAVSYFTGTLPGPDPAPAPAVEPDFPETQLAKARELSHAFVRWLLAEDLLPKLENPISPPQPRFEALHDPEGRIGRERLKAQLVRANSEPSERVTLAVPGATAARMKADETGYENLVVAGDWIDNGVQLACMEGAFSGGVQAGEAVWARL